MAKSSPLTSWSGCWWRARLGRGGRARVAPAPEKEQRSACSAMCSCVYGSPSCFLCFLMFMHVSKQFVECVMMVSQEGMQFSQGGPVVWRNSSASAATQQRVGGSRSAAAALVDWLPGSAGRLA